MKRSNVSIELPEGLSAQRAAGYLLFKTLINSPKKGTEVKKLICETLNMKYCGTVIQHHVKAGHLGRTYPDKAKKNKKEVVYWINPKAWAYVRDTFGLLSDKRKAALEAQKNKALSKVKETVKVTEEVSEEVSV